MGAESNKAGREFEQRFEELLERYKLKYSKGYDVMTMTGIRRIDFVVASKFGKVIVECKYKDPNGQIAAKRYASTGLFTLMYEYRKLFPAELMLAIVNDISILKPGKQNYIPLLASIGVEILSFEANGKPSKFLLRKLEELSSD